MLKYIVFWFGFNVLGRLPLPVLYRLADLIAEAAYILARGTRENVWDNLRHVYPPGTPKGTIRRAARQVFKNVVLYYADIAYLPRMDAKELFEKRLRLFGIYEHLLPAARSGRGVIMLSAHFGNAELAVQGLIPLGIRVFALTEPLEPAPLTRMMDRRRASKGHEFAPVSVGSVKRAIKTLREGGVITLMGDRDIQGPRQKLPFLGVETWMPTGPIEVALRTNAVLIPAFSLRRRHVLEAHAEEPLEIERTGDFDADVRKAALQFLQRFEARLRAEPGQWAVLERIWDEATPAESLVAVAPGVGRQATERQPEEPLASTPDRQEAAR